MNSPFGRGHSSARERRRMAGIFEQLIAMRPAANGVALANELLKNLINFEILDFGCGIGAFVEFQKPLLTSLGRIMSGNPDFERLDALFR
jgi:hypothetical protein